MSDADDLQKLKEPWLHKVLHDAREAAKKIPPELRTPVGWMKGQAEPFGKVVDE